MPHGGCNQLPASLLVLVRVPECLVLMSHTERPSQALLTLVNNHKGDLAWW